jgi:O-antigen/teichoic acid export membrane protein
LAVIGKLYSPTDLGFFVRAKSLGELPAQALGSMVGRVTFPVFSSIQEDLPRLKRGLKKALTIIVLVNFPMMIGLAIIARPLILLLFTEKWAESIPYFQLLCLEGLLYPLHLLNLNLLQALGRSDLFLRLGIMRKVLTVITIVITWQWGLIALIYAMIGASIISYYLNSYYTGILIGYTIWDQLRDIFPYLIMSALMAIVTCAAGLIPLPTHWSILLVQIVTGVLAYLGLCLVFRPAAFVEIWKEVSTKVKFNSVD